MEKAEKQKSEQKVWFLNNRVQAKNLNRLPRCTAVSISTGLPCKNVQMNGKNGLCCVHAGLYKPGAQKGNSRALKSGFFTKEALFERQSIREILNDCKSLYQDF